MACRMLTVALESGAAETGRKIGEIAGRNLASYTAELGGKASIADEY